MSTVVVAGASGFVGSRLLLALRDAGHAVRPGSRDPVRAARNRPGFDWVSLDVDTPHTLESALHGADVLVYLVHHLRAHDGPIDDHESASAAAIVRAAEAAGLQRIVYLGGPEPTDPDDASPHLRARLQTGEILRAGTVPCVELRASMIIGAGSESWLICRDLAMRLPVMVVPQWTHSRTAPIGIDDVVFALADAVDRPIDGSLTADLPGPEVLSGQQILRRIAALGDRRPVMIEVPLLTPRLSSMWLRLVTRADFEVARQLVDGLVCDLLPKDDGWWLRVPEYERTPFDVCARRALQAETTQGLLPRAWERWARVTSPRA